MDSADRERQKLTVPAYLVDQIIDMHAHFFPEKLFRAIWSYFAERDWGIRYQGTAEVLADTVADLGVSRFTVYNYAHKPGMAAALNRWTAAFVQRQPRALPFATIYPGEDGNLAMLDDLFERGFLGIKLHPLVSNIKGSDPRLDEIYQLLLRRGRILTIHAGTAPYGNPHVGAEHFLPVMERFPELKVIVAHLGAFETDRFLEMAGRFPNLYLDTAVSFIAPERVSELVSRQQFPPIDISSRIDPAALLAVEDRILFGSDFPNIPWSYQDCVDGVLALGLGERFQRKVFFENARRLLGLPISASGSS